jgi:DNA-binding CsgD family transcriptional regulator
MLVFAVTAESLPALPVLQAQLRQLLPTASIVPLEATELPGVFARSEWLRPAPPAQLSPREREVWNLLARGDSYKMIAATLHLSQHTVSNHIRKIYRKMGVNSRGQATAFERS